MRRMLTIALILVAASGPTWAGYRYNAGMTTEGVTTGALGGKFMVQGLPGMMDGNDGSNSDVMLDQTSAPKPFYAATYKSNGSDSWNAGNGFYTVDSRPALSAGQTLIEDIYVWAAPDAAADNIAVGAGGGGYDNSAVTYTLRLISIPNGVTYNGLTEWTKSAQIVLPFYSTTNGLTGYHFQAQLTAVPEPSSVLALLCGLGSVGVVVLRRRRT